MENVAAEVATEAHCGLCAKAHCTDRKDDLDEAEHQHDAAGAPDVTVVSPQDTLVNDVGIE